MNAIVVLEGANNVGKSTIAAALKEKLVLKYPYIDVVVHHDTDLYDDVKKSSSDEYFYMDLEKARRKKYTSFSMCDILILDRSFVSTLVYDFNYTYTKEQVVYIFNEIRSLQQDDTLPLLFFNITRFNSDNVEKSICHTYQRVFESLISDFHMNVTHIDNQSVSESVNRILDELELEQVIS